MALRISEYAGFDSGRQQQPGYANTRGFIRAQFSTSFSSTGSTGQGFTLSSGTYLILLDSDVGVLVAFGSSVSTGPTMTSTSAQHIPASVAPLPMYTLPYSQLFVSST